MRLFKRKCPYCGERLNKDNFCPTCDAWIITVRQKFTREQGEVLEQDIKGRIKRVDKDLRVK